MLIRTTLIFAVLLLSTSCATVMDSIANVPAQIAWLNQPEGARAAFIRCAHEVGHTQCGSSNVKDEAVEKCMQLQVSEYRDVGMEHLEYGDNPFGNQSLIKINKTKWLTARGCGVKRAELREGEI